jgi:hypothetical protein
MTMKRLFVLAMTCAVLATSAVAGQPSTGSTATIEQLVPDDPATLLGLSPAQVLARFGAPARVFAVRGAEAWQDDVVFDYGSGFSVFLFMDHVWQVRLAEPFARPVLGFTIGATTERIMAALGSPASTTANGYEWVLPGAAWPERLRGIIDVSGTIRELYIYRADF